MRKLFAGAVLLVACSLSLGVFARADSPNICPAVGAASECNVFLIVNLDGSVTILTPPSLDPVSGAPADTTLYDVTPAYTGADDYLIGVYNDSGKVLQSLSLSGNDIFAADGDGVCSGYFANTPQGCPVDPKNPFNETLQGYNGPNTAFYVPDFDKGNHDDGVVFFGSWDQNFNFTDSGGLGPGQTAFFSLENLPTEGHGNTQVPEPGTILLLGTGLSGMYFRLKRNKK
jgi:hypothetical protein